MNRKNNFYLWDLMLVRASKTDDAYACSTKAQNQHRWQGMTGLQRLRRVLLTFDQVREDLLACLHAGIDG